MYPETVWKIFKVPRSSMIILSFVNDYLPSEVIFDKEIIRVRPYRPRVLQCFNCFGFGHASRVCTRDKICESCSQPEHGECSRAQLCVNCKGNHRARNKECKLYKKEQEALIKSFDEHISVGHAKKLLSNKYSYSGVLKEPNSVPASSGASHSTSGGAPRAASGGILQTASGGASRAASSEASRAASGAVPQAASGGASQVASSEASQAASGAASRASSVAAPRATSGGAREKSFGVVHSSTFSRFKKHL